MRVRTMQGSPPQTSGRVSIPGNVSPRSRTSDCARSVFSPRVRVATAFFTSSSVLMQVESSISHHNRYNRPGTGVSGMSFPVEYHVLGRTVPAHMLFEVLAYTGGLQHF